MKQVLESKENFAEVLGFINEHVNKDLPFIPNIEFLGEVWGGGNKMFAACVCSERDEGNTIRALSVRLVSPNPQFKNDDDVKAALQMRPDMAGVLRFIDFGGSEKLGEFADLVAQNM